MSLPSSTAFIVWIGFLASWVAFPAAAQRSGPLGGDASLPPTPTPVGSGARAAGMGNAFIGIADDATAASWNPAGLVQLERPEFSFVGSLSLLRDRYSSNGPGHAGGGDAEDALDINYASFAFPVPFTILGRNATVSLNYQQKFDFNRRLDASRFSGTLAPLTPPVAIGQLNRLRFEQTGSLNTIGPAAAIEITQKLSIGIAANFWRDTFVEESGWEQRTRSSGLTLVGLSPSIGYVDSKEKYEDFSGENYTLGFLWRVSSRWSLGLRYDSAFTGEADYKSRDVQVGWAPFTNPLRPLVNFDARQEKRYIRIPDTLAGGVAFRANDRLTLALDISRTDWNDFYVKTGTREKLSLVDGSNLRKPFERTHLDPTMSVRFGGEYVFIPKDPGEQLPRLWSLRAGVFYEEEPSSNRTTRRFFGSANGKPDQFYGASVGVGLLTAGRFNFDLAYQLRYGPGVNRDLNPGLRGFDDDELRQSFFASVVIYF